MVVKGQMMDCLVLLVLEVSDGVECRWMDRDLLPPP
jgi:hypothetical protein